MDYGVRVLRFADYPVVPWRNGKGVTRDVAASAVPMASTNRDPDGADLPPLPAPTPAWRISMATVEAEVPFSDFSGLTRALGVVEGDGIELTVDGRMSTLRLGETFGPFAGGAPASARPLGDVTLDLGLIFDPARTRGELSVAPAGSRDIVGLIWFVVSLVDGLEVSLNGTPVATLARRDTAALDLRTAPIAHLSLSLSNAAPASDAADAASGSDPMLSGGSASAPLAYLVSIAP
ncbi:MAG: HutD family protein [Lacisediminihabitans sp.]